MFLFLPDSNIAVITALGLEKLIIRGKISLNVAKAFHSLNLVSVLVLPVYIINTKYEYIGQGLSSFWDQFVKANFSKTLPLMLSGIPHLIFQSGQKQFSNLPQEGVKYFRHGRSLPNRDSGLHHPLPEALLLPLHHGLAQRW